MVNDQETRHLKTELESKSEQALTVLCYDHFSVLYRGFVSSMSHHHKVASLFDYCSQNEKLSELMILLRSSLPIALPGHSIEISPGRRRLLMLGPKLRLELILDGSLADFHPDIQVAYLKIFAVLAQTSPDLIELKNIVEGSIILIIEMPTTAAVRFLELYDTNDSVISYLGIRQARIDLHFTDLQDAILFAADMRGAWLSKANLRGAFLVGAKLDKASLDMANMEDCILFGASMNEANLSDSNLYKADLRESSLEQVVLSRANLREARLGGANLREADLREAIVSGAKYTKETRWPTGFDPVTSGAILEKT